MIVQLEISEEELLAIIAEYMRTRMNTTFSVDGNACILVPDKDNDYFRASFGLNLENRK